MTQQEKPIPRDESGLFDEYFKVRYPYLQSRSIDDLRKYGYRVSGVEELDRNLDKQEITTELTINQMFEKYRAGVSISVINFKDTKRIYEIIHAHLTAAAEYLHGGVNVGKIPIEDLIELDIFAGVVYREARYVFNVKAREDVLSKNFMGVQTINFANILNRAPPDRAVVDRKHSDGVEVTTHGSKSDQPKAPERHSYREIFEQQMKHLHGWRHDAAD